MVELQEVFDVKYGSKFDLNKMSQVIPEIHFVGRSAKNNGVTAIVDKLENIKPYEAGLITVALGGSVLASFLQVNPFYTGQNIAVLTPLKTMTTEQKLFYCKVIQSNAYRFSTCGREANRTLKDLLVPSIDEIPNWVSEVNLIHFEGIREAAIKNSQIIYPPIVLKLTTIDNLFEIKNGIAATNLKEFDESFLNSVMYLRPASQHSRTLRSYIDKSVVNPENIYPVGSLFVSTNGEGSHSYSYVSTAEFVPNSYVAVLIPREEMSVELKLYYARCITANRYLFSYGRKPKGSKLKKIKIPFLPDNEEKLAVENFIKSLPYSSNI